MVNISQANNKQPENPLRAEYSSDGNGGNIGGRSALSGK